MQEFFTSPKVEEVDLFAAHTGNTQYLVLAVPLFGVISKEQDGIVKLLLCLLGPALVWSLFVTPPAYAADEREIAAVTTEWKALGANHRVVVMAYTDPDIPEITCYVSQAKTGGVSGSLGLAEDPSNFALSCVKTRPIEQLKKNLPAEARVFSQSTNIWFKSTRVQRIYDKEQATVVYLAISRHLIDGSPANAVSAVSLK